MLQDIKECLSLDDIKKIQAYLREDWIKNLYPLIESMEDLTKTDKNNGLISHCGRVAFKSFQIASDIGLNERDVLIATVGGMMHDIGKVKIDQNILNKPSALTAEERIEVETHSKIGYEILSNIKGIPKEVLDAARFHHERWDGRGYEKLSGEDIPLVARIVQIADVHDAIKEKRVYKEGCSEDEALLKMIEISGKNENKEMFDSKLLHVFMKIRVRGEEMDDANDDNREKIFNFIEERENELRRDFEIDRDYTENKKAMRM